MNDRQGGGPPSEGDCQLEAGSARSPWVPRSSREWGYLIALLLVVTPLFALRGHWGTDGNPDTVAVAVAAWQLANEDTLDLSSHPSIVENQGHLDRWYVYDKQGRIVSNRAPGLIALATPAYAIWPDDGFSNGPATSVALLLATLAVIISWRVFCRLVDIRFATLAAAILALGTTTWVISASELWPHGPGQFWAAIAGAGLHTASYSTTGVALGLSITTRPITAVFAAGTGLLEGWRLRSFRPVIRVGVLSALGLAAVMAYNRWLFGTWSITGGYSDSFTTGALDRFEVTTYVANALQMFIGATHGFLIVSPVLGFALYGAVRSWKVIPGWAKTLAWSSLAYLLVHAFSNRASGGLSAYYRYPLEAVTLAAPFLLLGAHGLWLRTRAWRVTLIVASVVSVLLITLQPVIVQQIEQALRVSDVSLRTAPTGR